MAGMSTSYAEAWSEEEAEYDEGHADLLDFELLHSLAMARFLQGCSRAGDDDPDNEEEVSEERTGVEIGEDKSIGCNGTIGGAVEQNDHLGVGPELLDLSLIHI